MSDPSTVDWPKNARALLVQAKQEIARTGELVRLILAGTRDLDSWLIENRILPAVQQKGSPTLRFSQATPEYERSISLVPLPDGSALARNASGRWMPLDNREARHEIQHIGFRHAFSKRWHAEFQATVQKPGVDAALVTPQEVAIVWEEATGSKPLGFEEGLLDQIHALGFNMMDKAFHTEGQLWI